MKILITGAPGFVGRNGKYQVVVTAMGYLSSMDDVAEIEDALKSRWPEKVEAQLQRQQIEFFRNSGVLLRSVLSRDAVQILLAGAHWQWNRAGMGEA